MDDTVRAQSEAVCDVLSEECTPAELLNWLEEVGVASLNHLYELEGLPEDEISHEDKAMMMVMEPFLFLLGLSLKHDWVARLEGEQ